MDEPAAPTSKPMTPLSLRILRLLVGIVVLGAVAAAGFVTYAYLSSPASIRNPKPTHFHLRLQVVVDGRSADFSQAAFQTPYAKDICTAALTAQPIHFHDGLDQFAHIHWQGVTGGLLLKNYGWNVAGGPPGVLGYRFDELPRIVAVPVHGNVLPARPAGSKVFIFTGNADGYTQRSWDQFLSQDLERFFGSATATSSRGWGGLIGTALAHEDAHATSPSSSEEERTKLNHVVGSAVIFVQKEAPSDAQIKDRFSHMIELPNSVCGG